MKQFILSITICCLLSLTLSAQDTYTIKNLWKGDYLNTNGSLQTSQIDLDSKSAHWQIIDVGNSHVRIMNMKDGTFLNIENGALRATAIEPGWLSALWNLNDVEGINSFSISNVWKDTLFINTEQGLACTPIENVSRGATWILEKIATTATSTPSINTSNNANSTSEINDPPTAFFNPEQLLKAHNSLRSEVGVPPLTWSNELATHAQEWADRQALNIAGMNAQNAHSRTAGMGENIAGGYVDFHPLEQAILDGWGKGEKENYEAATGKCLPSKVCGHYTQVVWRNTTQVGCGVGIDANGQYVLVCNYSPPGNYNGERPF